MSAVITRYDDIAHALGTRPNKTGVRFRKGSNRAAMGTLEIYEDVFRNGRTIAVDEAATSAFQSPQVQSAPALPI